MQTPLPIDEVLPRVRGLVADGRDVVVVAPPGAGKTTRVPPALLDLVEGRIVVLQPRRIAARSTAARMAAELGGPLGGLVGYQVRFERAISADTRIEVLTEGLLTRRLQGDPFLDGVGCVILDELHERSLHLDLALALLREVQREARPDLRLVAMSATLDPGPVAEFLDAEVVVAEGRTFPVEVSWSPGDGPVADQTARAVRDALRAHPAGHVLAFLPGAAEIDRAARALADLANVDVCRLHGRLPPAEQARALAPAERRKVVLATNIAETSVTLPGVRVVVDAGLARVPRFEVGLGLTRLETQRISRASADQRAGRAGRTGPGACVRLWSQAEDRALQPTDRPAMQREDLTAAALEVCLWGADPRTFRWFERPDDRALDHALDALAALGAVANGHVTAEGRALAALPLHPRIARVLRLGVALGAARTTATLAAILTDRDVVGDEGQVVGESDLSARVAAVDRARGGAAAQLRQARDQLLRLVDGRGDQVDDPEAAALRAFVAGFPERVGLRRAPRSERFLLAGGTGATLDRRSVVRDAPLIAALVVDGGRRGERAEHTIRVAAAIEEAWLTTREAVETTFDGDRLAVVQRRVRRFGALVLAETPAGADSDPEAVWPVLAAAAAADPTRAFAVADAAPWLARVAWLRAQGEDLPDFAGLTTPGPATPLIEALCHGRRSFADLGRLNLADALHSQLTYAQQRALAARAPTHLTLPDGRRAPVTYAPGEPPVLAARIQQLFGWDATPRVGGVPVRLHLLAPNFRPAQITDDLAGFWRNTYADVRKQLRGRYPKHAWPEDPLAGR